LGGGLQVGVESGGCFRICKARGNRSKRVIIAAKPAKTHEAGVDQLVVVVEFENLEKAVAAYESDLYRSALKLFDNAAERDFRIVEGR
jgi:uncharacterized protein (DUF1330 family)